MTRKEYIDILTRRLEGLDETSLKDIILEIEDHIDGLAREHPDKNVERIIDELEPPDSLADSLREAAGLGPYTEHESGEPNTPDQANRPDEQSEGSAKSSAKKTVRIVIDDEDLEEAIRKAFDIAKIFKRNRGGQRDESPQNGRRSSFAIKGEELDNLRRVSVHVRSADIRVLFSNDDFSVEETSENEAPGVQMQYDGKGILKIVTLPGPLEPDHIDLRIPASVDELAILTLSGDVHVVDRVGSLSITTASGDVDVETCEGDVDVKTASGDIRLAQCRENLKVSTASGDISIQVDDTCNSIEVSGASGDIALVYPDGWDALLSMSTVSGEIEHDGISVARGVTRIGNGLVPVKISTASGDIRIHRDE
jgi:DUF4097 and DUF4098 domain-containing protein YvlB